MRRDYDIFERFSDGTTICRATVRGRFEAERMMQELSEHSENLFFSVNIQAESSYNISSVAFHDSDEGERQKLKQSQRDVHQLRGS